MRKSYYRKPHRYRKRKPIFRKRFFWLGISTLLIIGGLFYSLFFSKVFQVEKIIVSGGEKISKEDVELLAENKLESKMLFLRTKSIFSVDLRQIRSDILNTFPQIAEVEITRGFFDAINILIIERKGLAIWCQEDNCFLIDNEGIIFEAISGPGSKKMILRTEKKEEVLTLGKRVIEKEIFSQILELKSALEEKLNLPVEETYLVSDERLNLRTFEGWDIYFNLKGDLDWQITELSLVLEKQISPQDRGELQYIDLRFSRVFYK